MAYFSSFVAEAAGLLWLAVCAAALVKLVWTKKLGLLAKFAKRLPRLAFFLTAIGWLPYAVTLFSFALSVAGTVITGELGRLALINIYNLSSYVWTGGLVLSLGYAVYRVFYKRIMMKTVMPVCRKFCNSLIKSANGRVFLEDKAGTPAVAMAADIWRIGGWRC